MLRNEVKQGQVWIMLVMLFAAAVLVGNAPQVEAAKKVRLYPYEIVAVTGRTGGELDSVWKPTDNFETHLITKGNLGVYKWMFDPGHGDSTTYGVDSLGGASNSDGLMYDTLDFYFHVLDYDGGWIGLGIDEWANGHGDADSMRVEYVVELGTKMGNNGVFISNRSLAVKERGIGVTHKDTITFDAQADDSTHVFSLAYEVEGGASVDSTLFLDWVRLRYVIVDSALILDQINDHEYEFRAFMLVKEEY